MKRITLFSFVTITALILFASVPQAFAETKVVPQRTVKAIMKDMGPLFRAVGSQVSDASKNAETIRALQTLRDLTKESGLSRPEKIANLPAEQQRAAEIKYLRMLLEVEILILDCEAALLNSDQAAALEFVKKMGQLRNLGHDEFQE